MRNWRALAAALLLVAALSSRGGATESPPAAIGTSASPVRTDPTGTTKQPVTVADGDAATTGTTTGPAVTTDANGTLQQYLRGLVKQWIAGTLVVGPGANVIGKLGIDQTTPGATNGVQVNAALPAGTNNIGTVNGSNVGGYDSGAVSATSTPANSSHAAGTAIGGLLTIAVARTNGGSGIITNLNWKSTGGSVGTLVLRVWQKNPANTTCTDNAAFVGSDADDANLVTPPFSLVPSAPAVVTGDTATYASAQGLTWDYKNADTSPGLNLYVCPVTVATDTADQNKLVRLQLSGPQN